MENVKKEKQQAMLAPVWKHFDVSPEIDRDIDSNYFWTISICTLEGIQTSITIKLGYGTTRSDSLAHITADDWTGEDFYRNTIKFSEETLISEIEKIIEKSKEKMEFDDYYLM